MKRFFLMGLLALLAVACNKNQKVVKQLDGTWNATSYVYVSGGVSTDIMATPGYGLTWEFDDCKLKDDEFCRITWTETYDVGSSVWVMEYRVAGYGTSLELRDYDFPSELIYLKIIEQSKTDLVVEVNDGDGDVTTITLLKE